MKFFHASLCSNSTESKAKFYFYRSTIESQVDQHNAPEARGDTDDQRQLLEPRTDCVTTIELIKFISDGRKFTGKVNLC